MTPGMTPALKRLVLGPIGTNVYLLGDEETKKAIIFDPADQAGEIRKALEEASWTPTAVYLTHAHFDHFGAAEEIIRHYGIPLSIGRNDGPVLADPARNLSEAFSNPYSLKADHLLKDGDEIQTPCGLMRVLETPGHTEGSVSYYFPDLGIIFSGDTLFCGSVGRSDLPGGNPDELGESINQKLMTLPDDTQVFPGHGPNTTINHERLHNPFI